MVIIESEPAPSQTSHLATSLSPLTRSLKEKGVNINSLLSKAMIPKNALVNPDYQLTPSQELTFLEEAINRIDEPGYGLIVGEKCRVSNYGLLGLAMMTSADLKQALSQLCKNILLTWTYTQWSVEIENSITTLSPKITTDMGTSHQYMVDYALSSMYNICKELLNAPLTLNRVNLVNSQVPSIELYKRTFNCPVYTGQLTNSIEFDDSYLTQALIHADLEAARIFAAQCDDICQRLKEGKPFTEIVKLHVLEPGIKIRRLDTVAMELQTTSRTVQRKLANEGTSFNTVLEDIRRDISIEYLENTNLSIEEIAIRLGYSDAPNFSHAFKKWTKCSPGAYRKQKSNVA